MHQVIADIYLYLLHPGRHYWSDTEPRGRKRTRYADTIASAIRDSRSKNEQFHALQLAKPGWQRLADRDRDVLAKVIVDDPFIPEGRDRRRVAEQLVGPVLAASDDRLDPATPV